MKRIWNAIGKPTKDANFQQKAVQHVEKMDGQKPSKAPLHEGEKKYYEEALRNEDVKKAVHAKSERLVDNMAKLTIRSTSPPERWTASKELPTRESEWEHRHDPVWEYGFYEPPLEKMPKGKLMLREAMEVLRGMQEADTRGESAAAAQLREKARASLDAHVAVQRVGREAVEEMYEYFRPFERRDTQKVVSRHDLARLQDALQGHGDEVDLIEGAHKGVKRIAARATANEQRLERLNDGEREELADAVKQLRAEEHERLEKRLKEVNEMEESFAQSVKDAAEKEQKEREEKKSKE